MTWGPRTCSSPGCPSGTSVPVSKSTTRNWVLGRVAPMVPGLVRPAMPTCVTGDDSVVPYPCSMTTPRRSSTRRAKDSLSGAAPQTMWAVEAKSAGSTSGELASASAMGGAM